MNKAMLLGIACATTVLSGCANYGGGTGPATFMPTARRVCIFTPCRPVVVQVEDGKVKVDTDEIKMYVGSRDIVLRWQLDSKDYEFRKGEGDFAAPIIFKGSNAPDAPGQFSDILVFTINGVQFATLFNRNRNGTTYEYKVRVYKKNSSDFLETDPRIINDY